MKTLKIYEIYLLFPRNVSIVLDSTAFATMAVAFVKLVGPASIAIGNLQKWKHQLDNVKVTVSEMANALTANAIVARDGPGRSVRKWIANLAAIGTDNVWPTVENANAIRDGPEQIAKLVGQKT